MPPPFRMENLMKPHSEPNPYAKCSMAKTIGARGAYRQPDLRPTSTAPITSPNTYKIVSIANKIQNGFHKKPASPVSNREKTNSKGTNCLKLAGLLCFCKVLIRQKPYWKYCFQSLPSEPREKYMLWMAFDIHILPPARMILRLNSSS